MNPEDALKVADDALFDKTGNRLTDLQKVIFQASLESKAYKEVEGYNENHVKNEGAKLWKLLSKALEQKVNKSNFRTALEHYQRHSHKSQENSILLVDSSEAAKKKVSNNPKLFYYISKPKIEILTTQLQISSPILDIKALVSNTLDLVDILKSNNNVVSLSNNIKALETSKYIEDSDIWYQGLYSLWVMGEEIVTYLSWKAFDSVFILLVGSPNNILGEKIVRDGAFIPGTNNKLLEVLRFANKVIKTDEPLAVALKELPLYGSSVINTHTLAENIVELSSSKIETPPWIDEKNREFDPYRKFNFSGLEEFCLNYISHLPPTRVETIFKVFSVFHCNHRTIFVGSPLYIAID